MKCYERQVLMNNRYIFVVLLILWAGLIIYISGIPHFSPGIQGLTRKIGHSLVYGIFTFLLWRSIPWFEKNLYKKILLCVLIVLGYATSDEFHQSFVPGRCGNIKGVFFDFIGATVMLLWFWAKNILIAEDT